MVSLVRHSCISLPLLAFVTGLVDLGAMSSELWCWVGPFSGVVGFGPGSKVCILANSPLFSDCIELLRCRVQAIDVLEKWTVGA